ncbi:Siroheme synthase [bacterium HR40]|nr:Siroheme synthase [bacterium HR40]
MAGRVFLVGAGPGDPELITLKGMRILGQAEVVLYDRLVATELLDLAPAGAQRIFVGKRRNQHALRQEEIGRLMIEHARQGRIVVRLKGGDPLVFGRGGEEIEALRRAGIPFEIVPGITAATGCAAAAAIPLTHRDLSRTLVLVTGHSRDGEPDLDWEMLCRPRQTLVFYMGHKVLARLCARLIEGGLPPHHPVAMVENGTLPQQRMVHGTLADIAERAAASGLEGPAIVIVGEVAAFADTRESED